MKVTRFGLGAVTVALIGIGACGDSARMEGDAMPGMPDRSASAVDTEHRATGTVDSLDAAAGTIDISHGPVDSVGWPAMTMQFRLSDANLAEGVVPGQSIEFRFTTEGGGTVTGIETR